MTDGLWKRRMLVHRAAAGDDRDRVDDSQAEVSVGPQCAWHDVEPGPTTDDGGDGQAADAPAEATLGLGPSPRARRLAAVADGGVPREALPARDRKSGA